MDFSYTSTMNITPHIPIKCTMCSEPVSLHDNSSSSYLPQTNQSIPKDPSDLVKKTPSKRNDDKSPSSPLLKLPLELREYIYEHVLSHDKQSLRLTRGSELDDQPENTFTAILATNHQVYSEARPFLLSGNAFLIRGTVDDHKWLKGLGPEGREQLRKVTFFDCSQTDPLRNYGCINILTKCPKLSLTIQIHCRQFVDLNQIGAYRYLHGFSRVAVENNHHVFQDCPLFGSAREGNFYVDMLLGQLKSPCPKSCRIHKAKNTAGYKANLRIVLDYSCPECYPTSPPIR